MQIRVKILLSPWTANENYIMMISSLGMGNLLRNMYY